MATRYKYIKDLLGENDLIDVISIPFGYTLSARKDNEQNYGLYKKDEQRLKILKGSDIPSSDNALERFLIEVLEGKGVNRKITIYLPPYKCKTLDSKYENSEFVLNDIKSKICRYVEILKNINPDKFKSLDIKNFNFENININYDGTIPN
ncbi:MAG: hypothetical protein RSB77_03600 [Bacilli bacterium]